MKKFGKEELITTYVDEKALVINVPIDLLKTTFEYSPNNYDESLILKNREKEFAELIAEHLHDEVDSEDGSTYIHKMLDAIYDNIFEGNIEAEKIVDFNSEY